MMGTTHKLYKAFILAITISSAAIGQINNFEFIQHDTTYVGSDSVVVMHGEIISLINLAQTITVTRVTHEIDGAWTNSFCVGPACLPPFLDAFTFDLAGSDTADFSLDTYSHGELGAGSWTIFVVDSSTMEVDSATINIEVVTVSVDGAFEKPSSFELSPLYPNPTNAWVNFDLESVHSGDYSVTLYALDGRQIRSHNYYLSSGKNRLQWSMQGLPSGNYIMRAVGAGTTISRQLSVIK